jgi:hypothetical protein
VVSATLWTVSVERRPATYCAGVGDKVDTIDDWWGYHRIVSKVSRALGFDTTLLDGWFWGVLKRCDAFELLGTTRPVTQSHISENLAPPPRFVLHLLAVEGHCCRLSDDQITWFPWFLDLTPTNLDNIRSFHPGLCAAWLQHHCSWCMKWNVLCAMDWEVRLDHLFSKIPSFLHRRIFLVM